MPIPLSVTRGFNWAAESVADAASLNATGTPVVTIPDGTQIPPEYLDTDALRDELDGALNPTNYLRRSGFWHNEWISAGGVSCPVGVLTENAYDWFARPTGAAVTVDRTESAPDAVGVYAARVIGATGVTGCDFGTWLPAAVAAELKGSTLTFSVYVKNVTGASINVNLFVACPGATLDAMDAAVDVDVSDAIAIANGEWVRCTHTFDAAAFPTFLYGALLGVRLGNVLTTALKSVEVAQPQLQIGGSATAWIKPTLPATPRAGSNIYPDSVTDVTSAPFDVVLQNRITGVKAYLAPPPAILATPVLGFNRATGRPEWIDIEGNMLIFAYTGADQYVTVPAGATSMTVHAWGAGGSNDAPSDSGVVKGGVGGYAKGVFTVTAGTQYTVVVGEGQHGLARRAYGFGGLGQGSAHNHNGGGLSGVFTGTSPVVETDFARALVIAAGGGSAGQSGNGASASQGGNGGDPARSGSTANFQGIDATGGQTSGNGGGGGGRYGGQGIGLGGKGGTSFVHSAATPNGGAHANASSNELAFAAFPSLIVPKINLDEYVAPAAQSGRPGLVVIVFA